MEEQVYRIMALGDGEIIDKAVACLAFEGFAVAQVSDQVQAERLLKRGGIDAVVADGGASALGTLLPAERSDRPWVILGASEGGPIPEGRATMLALPMSTDTLCVQLKTLISGSAQAKARAKRRKRRVKALQVS
ncbi:MAG: hypothetical protein ACE5FN_05920 [Leptospirillia bacterium]